VFRCFFSKVFLRQTSRGYDTAGPLGFAKQGQTNRVKQRSDKLPCHRIHDFDGEDGIGANRISANLFVPGRLCRSFTRDEKSDRLAGPAKVAKTYSVVAEDQKLKGWPETGVSALGRLASLETGTTETSGVEPSNWFVSAAGGTFDLAGAFAATG